MGVLGHLTHQHVPWTCLPGQFKALWTGDCITQAGAGTLLFVFFPYDAATGAEQFPLREVQTARGCTPYTLCDACQSSLSHVVTPDKALKSEGCSRLPV